MGSVVDGTNTALPEGSFQLVSLVTSGDVQANQLSEEMPKLEIRGAVVEGQVIEAAGVKALAELPPREVILAQLLGLLQAPASQLVRTLNEPAARLARLVDALGKRAGADASGGDA
jgi:ribosomal protein L10